LNINVDRLLQRGRVLNTGDVKTGRSFWFRPVFGFYRYQTLFYRGRMQVLWS